jgi:hypothetical protein
MTAMKLEAGPSSRYKGKLVPEFQEFVRKNVFIVGETENSVVERDQRVLAEGVGTVGRMPQNPGGVVSFRGRRPDRWT